MLNQCKLICATKILHLGVVVIWILCEVGVLCRFHPDLSVIYFASFLVLIAECQLLTHSS